MLLDLFYCSGYCCGNAHPQKSGGIIPVRKVGPIVPISQISGPMSIDNIDDSGVRVLISYHGVVRVRLLAVLWRHCRP